MTLTLSSGATVLVEGVLVAAGRSGNSAGLNLSAAGLTAGHRGLIAVDDCYRTTVPHIYAAGDVIGHPALASTSMEQARVAMCAAFDIPGQSSFSKLLPTGIYTIPETSSVGETEATARQQSIDYVVGRAAYRDNPRGDIIGDDTGFLKLIFRRADLRLLGVHVLGEHATEFVHVGLVALMAGAHADLFEAACFNFPTLGGLYKIAAVDAVRQTRHTSARKA